MNIFWYIFHGFAYNFLFTLNQKVGQLRRKEGQSDFVTKASPQNERQLKMGVSVLVCPLNRHCQMQVSAPLTYFSTIKFPQTHGSWTCLWNVGFPVYCPL